MIIDRELMFSNAQAVTAAAASTDLIDLAPLGLAASAGGSPTNLGRNLGVGQETYIWVSVDVAMTDTGSDSTITVDLQTDDNSGFASAATVATLLTIPAVQAAGAKFFVRVPIARDTVPYERYIRLNYTPNNGNLTTGSFSAGLILNIDTLAPVGTYVGGYTNLAG
jgi:hypothetical protein